MTNDIACGKSVDNLSALAAYALGKSDCDSLRSMCFTATDCNSLSFASYGAQAPPQHIDYILYREGNRSIAVAHAALTFKEKVVKSNSGLIELSDHYGYAVTFGVRPKARSQ